MFFCHGFIGAQFNDQLTKSLDPPLQIPAIVRFGQEDEARKLNDQIKEAKKAAERQTERFSRHVVKRICNDRNLEVEFLHE